MLSYSLHSKHSFLHTSLKLLNVSRFFFLLKTLKSYFQNKTWTKYSAISNEILLKINLICNKFWKRQKRTFVALLQNYSELVKFPRNYSKHFKSFVLQILLRFLTVCRFYNEVCFVFSLKFAQLCQSPQDMQHGGICQQQPRFLLFFFLFFLWCFKNRKRNHKLENVFEILNKEIVHIKMVLVVTPHEFVSNPDSFSNACAERERYMKNDICLLVC